MSQEEVGPNEDDRNESGEGNPWRDQLAEYSGWSLWRAEDTAEVEREYERHGHKNDVMLGIVRDVYLERTCAVLAEQVSSLLQQPARSTAARTPEWRTLEWLAKLLAASSKGWRSDFPVTQSEKESLGWDELVEIKRARQPYVFKAMEVVGNSLRLLQRVVSEPPEGDLLERIDSVHRASCRWQAGMAPDSADRTVVVERVRSYASDEAMSRGDIFRAHLRKERGETLGRRERKLVRQYADHPEAKRAAALAGHELAGEWVRKGVEYHLAGGLLHALAKELPRRSVSRLHSDDVAEVLRAFRTRTQGGPGKWALLNDNMLKPLGLRVSNPKSLGEELSRRLNG